MKNRWRSSLLALAIGVVMGLPQGAFANVAVQGGDLGSGADPISSYTIVGTRDELVTAIPVRAVVLGFKCTATAAGGACGLYDLASITSTLTVGGSGGTLGTAPVGVKDEMYENVTNTSNIQMWPKPWQVKNGVVGVAKNAILTIYY